MSPYMLDEEKNIFMYGDEATKKIYIQLQKMLICPKVIWATISLIYYMYRRLVQAIEMIRTGQRLCIYQT